MSNHNLETQLIESDLLDSGLESNLLSDLLDSDRVELKSSDSTNLDFTDSEAQTSLLYSIPLAMEGHHHEHPENGLEAPEETGVVDTPEAADIPLTKTITAGNPEGTQFTFNLAEDTSQEVIDGIVEAAETWSSILTDDVNISIDLTFTASEPGNLGGTVSNQIPIGYERLNQALAADVSSVDDQTVVDNLPQGNLDILINNTSENNGSDTPYLDNNGGLNNSFVVLNTANAKALGLSIEDLAESFGLSEEQVVSELNTISDNYEVNPDVADAAININSEIVWDFNTDDGIRADAKDFVGTVIHELGHALGFSSNSEQFDFVADPNFDFLDVLEMGPEEIKEFIAGTDLENLAKVTSVDQFLSENQYLLQVFDLFRYTPESFEQGAVDYTAGNLSDKYFSIDGGNTVIAPISTGTRTGDRQQLAHWKDNVFSGVEVGIMDPTEDSGNIAQISDTDLLAFDAIGWDLA